MSTVFLLSGEKGFKTIKFVTLLVKMDQHGRERKTVKVIPEIEEQSENFQSHSTKLRKLYFRMTKRDTR
jgi:hypothetical protein